jgi:hypothetical protein
MKTASVIYILSAWGKDGHQLRTLINFARNAQAAAGTSMIVVEETAL